ncbi:NAD-dependent succinate-semialdehyde dehydrogenase [Afifella marina]|uniref:Succinate-semialdehyde dehydrogenase / glutarate-semialdehyde dehydrogenase n=1 Tax=Afifella marina DSM 2698 TaxID=1120955 RepID=A0A1G5M315_AFIMA|nr:NAD-dependent succinate-semialdehyde dehydrogenase [Afifella marina]MBK1623051.1 NAD-dependent succinate-semialdehyde dehydrogenase [Afifella marina DSM 2698]MBK1626045.1 NAD-dependent succinate-semialdehyde dehydrogenase [Afifella marina]MBK5917869.1 succinate-semialdehyde dehydrogenase (NADP(+)) [Afifella marina]RAI18196.1 succinate-semialdehyde dehydrogenase (NADP(+)) [Afifella marina DSM 2698]SCZ19552.1 succinate-semialdehyde dehydrogenase / glutarate-semialdehyde dehydrogenase [Afifell
MLQKTHYWKREANLIGEEWVGADSGETIDVTNPATGETIGTIPKCGKAETERAIEAAAEAFESFKKTSADERAKLLRALHDAIMDNQDALAELLTLEQGKPLTESKGEVGMSAAYVLWFAEEARRIYGDLIPSPWKDRRIMVTKQPVGVIGAITPWNFPSSMLSRKIGPAIAAGCTAVVKPATQTPYSGLAWGALCEEVGIPKGVVNVVTGSAKDIGAALMESPKVRKVTFTGSTDVGKVLIRQSADTVKKVSMELGGNAPFLVFDDADIDRAVAGGIAAKFRNSGQTCVCTNRFYVQAGIYDRFAEKFAEAAKGLKVGSGLEEGTQQGPLIDDNAVAKVEELIGDAVDKGGKVIAGGKRHELGGTFFEPTVIADAKPEMRFSKEEIFGPVSPLFKFETEEEAVALANDTEYGLACYFYTQDLGRAFRVSEGLDYGLVGVNEGVITTEVAPFGGVKESGLGREGSKYGIDDYLEIKYVCIGGLGL